jgi:hypothetical protein
MRKGIKRFPQMCQLWKEVEGVHQLLIIGAKAVIC